MSRLNRVGRVRPDEFPDPGWYVWLFGSAAAAPLWLVVRFYLGWQWLESGWGKVRGEGWLDGGEALRAYWERAVAIPEAGRPQITYDWYRDFLQYMLDNDWHTWMAWVIALGEVIAGLALIIGLLTGLAALGGAFMNFNFLLAGTASTNPVMFALAILVLLAWRVSGWIGVDRWLLPALGTPWSPGVVVKRRSTEV
jgi:thiosulfate dehydrogenase (quinone) large subunit